MKIRIIDDKGKEEVFENITDYCLTVRQLKSFSNKKKEIAMLPETRSFSYDSGNLRELIKEISQSVIELQDILRRRNENGNT